MADNADVTAAQAAVNAAKADVTAAQAKTASMRADIQAWVSAHPGSSISSAPTYAEYRQATADLSSANSALADANDNLINAKDAANAQASIAQKAADKASTTPPPAPDTATTATQDTPQSGTQTPPASTLVDNTSGLTPSNNTTSDAPTSFSGKPTDNISPIAPGLGDDRRVSDAPTSFSGAGPKNVAATVSGMGDAGVNKSEANYPQETDDTSIPTPVTATESGVNLDQKIVNNSSPNILHNYSSYTYSLSLHALGPSDYKKLVAAPGSYTPSTVLIASGGRYGDAFPRSDIFREDFFFDKMDLETVIGLNNQNRNSNTVTLNFTLIEPYGMTLLNRLLDLGKVIDVKGNYIAIPYLIQIDFFGYKPDGVPVKIEGITKCIPIKIATLGMKVSQKGAEYNITAYPFNHQAFSETIGTVPFKLEVTAATLGDFFLVDQQGKPSGLSDSKTDAAMSSSVTDVRATAGNDQEIAQNNALRAGGGAANTTGTDTPEWSNSLLSGKPAKQTQLMGSGVLDLNAKISDTAQAERVSAENRVTELGKLKTTAAPTELRVFSYPGAINRWQEQIKKDNQQLIPDKIYFEIDPTIAECKFPNKDKISWSARSYDLAKDSNQTKHLTNVADGGDTTINHLSIDRGTSILEVINLAVKSSTYIYDQILDTTLQLKPDKVKAFLTQPMKWFKVIPRIEIGEYDTQRNEFSKIITYQVIPFEVHNTKSEDAPLGGPKKYVKDYQYIFTGKNNDILNFDLKFDTLYFSAKTANPANREIDKQAAINIGSKAKVTDAGEALISREELQKMIDERIKGSVSMRHRNIFVGHIPNKELGSGAITESVARVNKNILTNPSGDMISVDLKIIGDPDFIKQDDYFYSPANSMGKDKTGNGSIVTDDGEIFVNLKFNTPGDYDSTGIAMPNGSPYSANSFSGIYRVLTVKSNFGNGKFEQNLSLIRYPNQNDPGEKQVGNSSADRTTDTPTTNNQIDDTRPGSTPAVPNTAPTVSNIAGMPPPSDPNWPAMPNLSDRPDLSQNALGVGSQASIAQQGGVSLDSTEFGANNKPVQVDMGGSVAQSYPNTSDGPAPSAPYSDVPKEAEPTPIGTNSTPDGTQVVAEAVAPPTAVVNNYQAQLESQAGKTITTTDGYQITYDKNGMAESSVSPNGTVSKFDALGNQITPANPGTANPR